MSEKGRNTYPGHGHFGNGVTHDVWALENGIYPDDDGERIRYLSRDCLSR